MLLFDCPNLSLPKDGLFFEKFKNAKKNIGNIRIALNAVVEVYLKKAPIFHFFHDKILTEVLWICGVYFAWAAKRRASYLLRLPTGQPL